MNDVKLCINCKFYTNIITDSWCVRPTNEINSVTGGYTVFYLKAWEARKRSGICGPEAKLFEQKVTLFGKIKSYFGG